MNETIMAAFKSFCSRPRSCILVTLLLVFTACVYLVSVKRGQPSFKSSIPDRDSKLNGGTELTVPESVTLLRSSNDARKVSSQSSESINENYEPERHLSFQTDSQSVRVYEVQHKSVLYTENSINLQSVNEQDVYTKPLDFQFDPSTDTLVVIHIQKTGGSTFIRHLVTVQKNGEYLCTLSKEAKNGIENRRHPKGKLKGIRGLNRFEVSCPHDPLKPGGGQWLISEKNVGWICGAHATLMEFEDCLPKLDIKGPFHYMVTLRHPVLRYVSEYLHFQRNATWPTKRHCGGKEVTEDEMPTCFPGFYDRKPWININLDKFLSCESNWANNRQTMALADLKVVGCYDKTRHSKEERERLILKNAKDNLRRLAFFGITEYMNETCTLFEQTFNVTFVTKIAQKEVNELHSAPFLQELWNNTTLFERVVSVNRLDMELYEYGLELFIERARNIGIAIDKNIVNKQIAAIAPEDVRRISRKYKKLNYSLPP